MRTRQGARRRRGRRRLRLRRCCGAPARRSQREDQHSGAPAGQPARGQERRGTEEDGEAEAGTEDMDTQDNAVSDGGALRDAAVKRNSRSRVEPIRTRTCNRPQCLAAP